MLAALDDEIKYHWAHDAIYALIVHSRIEFNTRPLVQSEDAGSCPVLWPQC